MKLNKTIIHDISLSSEAIAVYVSLCYYNNDAKVCCVTDPHISGMLSQGLNTTLKIVKHISELEAYIDIIDTDYKRYIINREHSLISDDDYYISVRPEHIADIINSFGKDRYNILRTFICLAGTFTHCNEEKERYKGKVGFMSQEHLATITGLCLSTIKRCFVKLEEHKIIYKLNSDRFNGNNYYSLYQHKDILNAYKAERENKKSSLNDILLDDAEM